MCDKTAIFDDDSDVFDECEALNTESPTRIFSMTSVIFFYIFLFLVKFIFYKFFKIKKRGHTTNFYLKIIISY